MLATMNDVPGYTVDEVLGESRGREGRADPAKPSIGELPPKHSTSIYNPYNKPVLRRPIEPTTFALVLQGVAWFGGRQLAVAAALAGHGCCGRMVVCRF